METLPLFASEDKTPQKRCSRCGEMNPIDKFLSPASTVCRMCRNQRYKAYRTKLSTLQHDDPPSHIVCIHCGQQKPIDEFPKDKTNRYKHRPSCKKCNREYRAKRKNDFPETTCQMIRKSNLKASYGITSEAYNAMLQAQNGVCAVCKRPESLRNQYGLIRLAVDHCHTTGNIRGLLCSKCNTALGMLRDDPTIIQSLLCYVNETKEER